MVNFAQRQEFLRSHRLRPAWSPCTLCSNVKEGRCLNAESGGVTCIPECWVTSRSFFAMPATRLSSGGLPTSNLHGLCCALVVSLPFQSRRCHAHKRRIGVGLLRAGRRAGPPASRLLLNTSYFHSLPSHRMKQQFHARDW
jgi:hypothetical protein